MITIIKHALGHLQLNVRFASDERVSAHGSGNSAGMKKTGIKVSGRVKNRPKAEIFLGVLFKSYLRKGENDVFGDLSCYVIGQLTAPTSPGIQPS